MKPLGDKQPTNLSNLGAISAGYGLALMLVAAIAYLRFFLGGSHRCGIAQVAVMGLGALIVLLSWRVRPNSATTLLRRMAAILFFLTAMLDLLLFHEHWSIGYFIAFVSSGVVILLLPGQFISVEKVVVISGSTIITVLLIIIPMEIVLQSEYSQYHLFGIYGDLPPRLQPTLKNSLGYRDVEHNLTKPPGVTRVLILGDSFTYGYKVADNEAYPQLLAQMTGPNVEFITLARPGWSTFDELSVLKEQGLAYDPDLVVLGVFTNDPEPAPDLEYLLLLSEWKVCTCIPLNFKVLEFVDYQINRLSDQWGLRYGYTAWENNLYDPQKPYWPAWQRTVREFGQELQAHNLPGVVFLLASPVQPQSEQLRRKYELLEREFSQAGFQTVNLWSVYTHEFTRANYKDLWALPNDSHPGPELHAFFAREIWQVLEPQIEALANYTSSE